MSSALHWQNAKLINLSLSDGSGDPIAAAIITWHVTLSAYLSLSSAFSLRLRSTRAARAARPALVINLMKIHDF